MAHSKKFKSVISFVLLMLFISMVSVIGMVVFTFDLLNKSNAANTRERVAIAFDVEQKRLNDILGEYAHWDEAYSALISAPKIDPAWLERNIGQYLFQKFGIEIAITGVGLQKPVLSLFKGQPFKFDFDVIKASGLDEIIAGKTVAKAQENIYFSYENRLYMAAVMSFYSEDINQPVGDGAYLLLAKPVDNVFLKNLTDLYKLPKLSISTTATANNPMIVTLENPAQQFVADISWQADSYVSYMSGLIVFVVFIGFANLILARYVFLQESNNRRIQQEELIEAANKDYLTGIFNRRAFIQNARQELDRSKQNQSNLTLLLLDLDHFKRVNDTFGHQVGDKVLETVSQMINENLRQYDVFARFGGEEFVILLPDASEELALSIAERIRLNLAQAVIPLNDGAELTCTVSIGIAHCQAHETLDSLLSRADEALYVSKHNGRNQCNVA